MTIEQRPPEDEPVSDHAELLEDAYPLGNLMEQSLAPLRDEDQGARPDSPVDLPQKARDDLQWRDLLELVSEEAVTPEGRQLLPELVPLADRGAVERRLREIREAFYLLAEDDPPPLVGLRDIRRAVSHATREGALVAEDLAAIAQNCDVASRNHRYFESRRERVPFLAAVGRKLDPCDELRRELHHAVEPGGQLSDRASGKLRKLRRSVQNQHDRLRARVDQLLRRHDIEVHLQDDYYTVREERYVLPVRVSAKAQVPGIVHGYSSSGQTAFIEPTELVDLNNELRWAEIELQAEEDRILQRLSRMVADFAPRLERNTEVLAYLDIVVASARFGERIDATIPELTDDRLELKQVRHPLLYLQHLREVDGRMESDVVANDLLIEPDERVLVVSGPNTGGKTVLLKTLGLCALMARCGLPIPAGDESAIPLYDSLYTDIGDEQSIERDLSTFSGHLTNINTFLDRCGDRSLVLLDELFTGTDPLQGAALAIALLEDLADRGATTAVTTHLEHLKTLAVQNEAFANASMGFDVDAMEPTFRLTLGVPGSSFAVRIARRLGFPEALVERALEVLEGEEHHSVEKVLSSLEEQLNELRDERERLEEERRLASRRKERYEEKYREIREAERESVHEETRQLKEKLREARSLIREKIKEVQASKRVERGSKMSQRELTEMQHDLEEAEDAVEDAGEKTKPTRAAPTGLVQIDPAELEEDMEVFVESFNRTGSILEFDADDKEALVQIGALKATVDADELYFPSEEKRRSHERGGSTTSDKRGGDRTPTHEDDKKLAIPQTGDNTVDLRGLRVDEALDQLESFLDQAFLQNRAGVHVIHGHGTGALKRAVRGYLVDSPYADDFRPGDKHEGGDGVTVVALADDPGL
ncbi:MAG: endonuclease MutS2 [Persicimonas sp.]